MKKFQLEEIQREKEELRKILDGEYRTGALGNNKRRNLLADQLDYEQERERRQR